jgi:hypothetical protein
LIAGGMPERVVDMLEVVEVHEQQGQCPPAALGMSQRAFQVFSEHQPVGQLGEAVVVGEKADLLARLPEVMAHAS